MKVLPTMSQSDRSAINAAARLLHGRFPVARVMLYGSKARGDDDAESDIDLLVLLSREITRDERHEMTRALSALGREMGVVFSARPVPESIWEHGWYRATPLRHEVDRDGVDVEGTLAGN